MRRAGYKYKKKSSQKTFRRKRYAYPSRSLASHNFMTKVVSDQLSLVLSTSGNITLGGSTYGIGIMNMICASQCWVNLIEPSGVSGISNTFNKMRIRRIRLCYCPATYLSQPVLAGTGYAGGAIFEIGMVSDRTPTSLGVASDYNISLIDNRKIYNQNVTFNQ